MRYSISLTEQAKADLIEIYRYIAINLQSEQNAKGQLLRLEEAIASLAEIPERFRTYDKEKWKKRNLRIMPVDNYLVFYIPIKENVSVTVLRIMYDGRDIDRQLNDL